VALDKLAVVAVDTTITPELRSEGLARELVRRIQDMRKKAGFNIEDRIIVYYDTTAAELASLVQNWAAYIQAETLASALIAASPQDADLSEAQTIEAIPVILGVKR